MGYLRIGTGYYKKVQEPLLSGDQLEKLIRWQGKLIELDHGKDRLKNVPKYDGFCIIPSHDDYKEQHGHFYNRYEKLGHQPQKGDFHNTEMFLRHIFEEHYLLALDYLTILWRYPSQTLPVLALVSTERNTGKSTFLYWLKMIFEKNMTINSNADFDSRFNSDWSDKLIIGIDEVMLNTQQHSEKLKQLATAKSIKSEAKGKDKVETQFFGKIILNANDETSFIKTDSNEVRYWVRKVQPIATSMYRVKSKAKTDRLTDVKNGNPDLLDILKKELNHFIYFIKNRTIAYPKASRMWFTKDQIHTKALDRLVKGSRSNIYNEINCVIADLFSQYELDELCYSAKDLVEILKSNGCNTTNASVTRVLQKEYNMTNKNSTYSYYTYLPNYRNANTVSAESKKGRFYTFKKSDFTVDPLTEDINPVIIEDTIAQRHQQ